MATKHKQINNKILKYIKANHIVDDLINNDTIKGMFFTIMAYHIDKYARKTFNKILCEQFCQEYTLGKENIAEKALIDRLYKDVELWENELPIMTLKRLQETYK